MATKKQPAAKYRIRPKWIGREVWTLPPIYPRPGASRFILDEKLSQRDLGYLFEVIGHEAVELVK